MSLTEDVESQGLHPGTTQVFTTKCTSLPSPTSTTTRTPAPLSPSKPRPTSTHPSLTQAQLVPALEGPHDLGEEGQRHPEVAQTPCTSGGSPLKAASLEKLIQLCVDAFTDDGIDKKQEEYVTVFFLVHQWFMTSEELAQAFLDLYQGCGETVMCSTAKCQHTAEYEKCNVQIFKRTVCQVLRYWICHFPLHFNLAPGVAAVVEKLSSVLQEEGNIEMKDLIDVSNITTHDWMRNMSVKTAVSGKHPRKVSLVFKHLEPKELAEHLTYLEYKAFRRIQLSDYRNYTVTASLKDQPKLERSVALFNGLSQWVQCMVLSKTTPQQRADVMCKFIDVSKHLLVLQNFNTMMAIVGGLSHSALARLSKTVSCLPPESQKTLMDLAELVTSNNNFSTYRKVYHQCSGFKIPILGVHLKDLIALHTALPDRIDGGLLNFRKMAQLAIIVKELTRLQSHDSCPVDTNIDLVNTLRLSLDMYHTEDEIYELSLAREPRGSMSAPPTPTKSVEFADWLSGVSPPDVSTINKHVHDMVEAVFKNYDYDRNGLISHEEFETITGNFPFIDSFCVLDTDKDGMISKQEMETYFVRANSHALRNSFKHAFHETTYFKPTFCIHCAGLLWGLIKQGWKCKDCGISAHKHCKDLVVMECRSKSHKRSGSTSNEMEPDDLPVATKWDTPHREQKRSSPSHLCQQSTQTERHVLRRASSLTSLSSSMMCSHQNCADLDREHHEEQALTCEHLLKSEEVCEKLMEENSILKSKLQLANTQISLLKSELGTTRQKTVSFILEQMDTLHMQSNAQV